MTALLGALAVLCALLLGFLAGLVTYQKSRRWCTVCGATLSCAHCRAGRAA
jgi:hypothetical protein